MAEFIANKLVAAKRIETLREILLASGWTEEDGAYLAPASIREEVRLGYGRGGLHIWDALNAQTRFDCFIITDQSAA